MLQSQQGITHSRMSCHLSGRLTCRELLQPLCRPATKISIYALHWQSSSEQPRKCFCRLPLRVSVQSACSSAWWGPAASCCSSQQVADLSRQLDPEDSAAFCTASCESFSSCPFQTSRQIPCTYTVIAPLSFSFVAELGVTHF